MPDGLKHEPDARFFREGLDSAALVVHAICKLGEMADSRGRNIWRTWARLR